MDCPLAVKPLNKQTLAKYNSLLYDVPLSPNRSVLISTCAHLYLGGLGGLGTFVSWLFLAPAWPTQPSCRASMSGARKHCLFSFHKNWAKAFSISSCSFRNSSKTCFFFMQSGKVAHHPLDLISLSADGILQWPLIVKSLCSNRAIGISNNTKSTCQKWVLYCTLSYAIIILILHNGQISSDGTCDSCFIQFHRCNSVATVYTSEYRAEPFHGWGDCVFWHCFPNADRTVPIQRGSRCSCSKHSWITYIYITLYNLQELPKAEAILMVSPRTIKSKHYVL